MVKAYEGNDFQWGAGNLFTKPLVENRSSRRSLKSGEISWCSARIKNLQDVGGAQHDVAGDDCKKLLNCGK